MKEQKDDLVARLRGRARIRRQIPTRKSVQEGQPDRIADLLDEAADALSASQAALGEMREKLEVDLAVVTSERHAAMCEKEADELEARDGQGEPRAMALRGMARRIRNGL